MAIHTELQIYKLAYQLFDLAADLPRNMPRDFKRSIGGRISEECLEVMVLIARANAATMLVRLSHDKRLISHALYARAAELTDRIGRQAGGWLKWSHSAHPAAAPAA